MHGVKCCEVVCANKTKATPPNQSLTGSVSACHTGCYHERRPRPVSLHRPESVLTWVGSEDGPPDRVRECAQIKKLKYSPVTTASPWHEQTRLTTGVRAQVGVSSARANQTSGSALAVPPDPNPKPTPSHSTHPWVHVEPTDIDVTNSTIATQQKNR